jgi:hypothetical protein
MTEHDNTFLLPDAQDTTYQLTVEDRIKVLKNEGLSSQANGFRRPPRIFQNQAGSTTQI